LIDANYVFFQLLPHIGGRLIGPKLTCINMLDFSCSKTTFVVKIVAAPAEVAKWQTQLTQNHPRFTPHVGSSPTFGILSNTRIQMNQPKQDWAVVQFQAPSEQEDLCSWLMFELGALGCEVENLVDNKILLKSSFKAENVNDEKIGEIARALEGYSLNSCLSSLRIESLPDEDWLAKWKEGLGPFRVGEKLLITPPWCIAAAEALIDKGSQMLIIDPGMAFGTGLHATTQYCLKSIEKELKGDKILDVGTGSGILAIACALLYKNYSIVGIDIEADALGNAQHNLILNKVKDKIKLVAGEPAQLLPAKFDTLLSNITCEDIIALLPVYIQLLNPHGQVICAGILKEKINMLEAAIAAYPLKIVDREYTGEWAGVRLAMTS
jgi:ribosomal protein L11 methyltransferase